MDNIVYLCELQCGLQLSLDLKVIFHSGKYRFLCLIFGPFRTRRDIRTWKEKFFDEFLKICRQLPEVDNCVRSSDDVKGFDAKDKSVFRPDDVGLLAEQIINLYLEHSNAPECFSGLSNRYYDWVAALRFDFLKQGVSHTVDRNFGPLNDIASFKAWWRKFKKGVREKAADVGNIRFRVLKGEFVELEEFPEGEEDFFEITCWNPEMSGQNFLSDILREWLQKHNSFG